jgi:16S rRNA (adenine(1408)-N(1))-methyltransferase
MRLVKGNNLIEVGREEFVEVVKGYFRVELDLGTGDGRFVYEKALDNKDTLYIGVDPSQKQLEVYSKRAVRKKLENVLFVVGSVENIPGELEGLIDKIYVILPWGTLLQSFILPDEKTLGNIKKLLKVGGRVEVILGYAPEAEPSETERLNLPEINGEFLREEVAPFFNEHGFRLVELKEIDKSDLAGFATSWSKKLRFGKERSLFHIEFVL